MTLREELHHLVDELPTHHLALGRRLLTALLADSIMEDFPDEGAGDEPLPDGIEEEPDRECQT